MRRWLAPEVVQSSALDCGPAALTSLFEGFGIQVSYGRLREACQTGLDGTCIDTMEVVANQLGLAAEQIMTPLDHLLLPESQALPAIVVTQLPDGMTHFVVVWRRQGPLLQVMDPAHGRRWVSTQRFLRDVYKHRMVVPADGWREFAGSEEFQNALRARMRRAGIWSGEAIGIHEQALADSSHRSLAVLDAAVRVVTALQSAGALARGAESVRVLDELTRDSQLIPAEYWSAAETEPDEDGAPQVCMTGAVLVRALDKRAEVAETEPACAEVQAASNERPVRPWRVLMQSALECGPISVLLCALGVVLSSAGVLLEALLFRSLLDITSQLHIAGQRAAGMAAILAVSIILLLLDWSLVGSDTRFGRGMELRLRLAFLRKLPKLGDRYFQSRLTSDMAERSHVAHQLRHVANFVRQFAAVTLKLCFTALALIWLEPSVWGAVVLMTGIALAIPFATQWLLGERDLRVRSHAAALSRYVLDALLGLVTVRAHGAERNLRSEQEKLLGSWGEAALRLQQTAVRLEAFQLITMFGLSAALLLWHPIRGEEVGRVLLVLYWALNLPTYGQDMCVLARKLPYYRNLTLRLMEPLGAPEEECKSQGKERITSPPSIAFHDVSVEASGHAILSGIKLEINPGAHVAVVGPSGAGKSSLVGLLLGWWKPSAGRVEVNGAPLDCELLRRSTAWIDPAVQLWNRSLFSNIEYGSKSDAATVAEAADNAMLRHVLESLPEGMQTKLGEGGAFVSGGEGQRVRLARAMLRADIHLALLDEPFRGLDRERRRELLQRARRLWRNATLICVTHDISETVSFDQVLVVENGRISECGSPRDLAANRHSRYAELLTAEQDAREGLWAGSKWRRIRVQKGRLVETFREASHHEREESVLGEEVA